MGLVHTAIRSKLGVEKVRKTTIVGMDIKRMHLETGLLHARGKRNFSGFTQAQNDQPEESDDLDIVNNDDDQDPLDFNQLSTRLIEGAASANVDKDVGDNDDDSESEPPPPLRITIPPLNSATLNPAQRAPVRKTSIPLKTLFIYPAAADLPLDGSRLGMNSFWKGGIQNLEKEMEAYDLLSLSEENADATVNPEIPTASMH